MGFLSSVVGAVLPGLVGGAAQSGFDRKAQRTQIKENRRMYERERKDFKSDTANARRYAEDLTRRDRDYYGKMLTGDRTYSEGITAKDRAYNAKLLADERRYQAGRLTDDRKYMEKARVTDKAAFLKAQAQAQRESDLAAERTTASRGIDFAQLRDDAVKAGFNPLTAMSMAHAYSTEVGYQNAKQVWNADGSYRVSGDGYGAAPMGGSATPITGGGTGAPMSIGAPSGGFVSSGAGYSSASGPAMSSGSFISEALARGVDTWLNSPDPNDAIAQNVAAQVQAGYTKRLVEQSTPRDFGYNLSKIEPYRPAVGVLNPPFRPKGAEMSPSDELTTPSTVPLKTPWGDLPPSGKFSDSSAWEERYGDMIGGGLAGAANLGYDLYQAGKPVDDWTAGHIGAAVDAYGAHAKRLYQTRGPKVPAGQLMYNRTGSRPYAPPFRR